MTKLLILLALVACGNTKHKIRAKGIPDRIEVIHKIDLDNLKGDFINQCEQEFDTQIEIDACVSEKINELLDFFQGITNDNEQA